MNYKNRIYDTVTTYMKKLSELDSFEKELAAQERAELISRVHAAERREEWEQQRKDAYENTINEIEHIRRSHTEAVDTWNELSGDKLSADAELLKMDISMDQRQFQALCSKHKDNSLMLQLLCDYADRHPDEPLYADRPCDAKTRKADFDAYAASATNIFRDPHSIRAGMFLENIGVPAACFYEY